MTTHILSAACIILIAASVLSSMAFVIAIQRAKTWDEIISDEDVAICNE